jgi:hypothetical protein
MTEIAIGRSLQFCQMHAGLSVGACFMYVVAVIRLFGRLMGRAGINPRVLNWRDARQSRGFRLDEL